MTLVHWVNRRLVLSHGAAPEIAPGDDAEVDDPAGRRGRNRDMLPSAPGRASARSRCMRAWAVGREVPGGARCISLCLRREAVKPTVVIRSPFGSSPVIVAVTAWVPSSARQGFSVSRGAGCGCGPTCSMLLSRMRGDMPGYTAAWSARRLSEASAIVWSSLDVSRAARASTRARFGGGLPRSGRGSP